MRKRNNRGEFAPVAIKQLLPAENQLHAAGVEVVLPFERAILVMIVTSERTHDQPVLWRPVQTVGRCEVRTLGTRTDALRVFEQFDSQVACDFVVHLVQEVVYRAEPTCGSACRWPVRIGTDGV